MNKILNGLKKYAGQLANYLKILAVAILNISKSILCFPKSAGRLYKESNTLYRIVLLVIGLYIGYGIILSLVIFGFNKDTNWTQKSLSFYPIPAVMVNYQSISLKEFYRQKNYVQNYASKSGQEMPGDDYILDEMIDTKLAKQQAAKYDISITKEEFEEVYNKKAEEIGGKDALIKILEEYYGMSENEFKKLMFDNMLREKLGKELPVQVKARHILVKDEKIANEILQRIKNGEVFEELAKQYSEDTASRDQGGDLGWFGKGVMVEDFEKAVFDASAGSLLENLVKSEFGFHIIRVDERKGEIDKSFDQWFSELREKSKIWKFI